MRSAQRPVTAIVGIVSVLALATTTADAVVPSPSTPPSVTTDQHVDTAQEIRSFPTADLGVSRPEGLAWSPQLGALLVPGSGGPGTTVARVRPDETDLGTTRLPGVPDGDTLAIDPADGTATAIAGDDLVSLPDRQLRRDRSGAPTGEPVDHLDLGSPEAMTYDDAGDLVVLDGGELVRERSDGASSSVAIEGADQRDLRGLSAGADSELLYTFDAETDDILGIDRGGQVVEIYDTGDAELRDVQGVAVAPSADSTDDPSVQSVYLADAGGPQGLGEIVELTLAPVPVALAAADGTLVRTVDTSGFDPSSPDPSGLAYLPGADRLFIADGEVDEMSIFENVNLFAVTRAGSVSTTGVSQPWSDEPVGVGYNPGNNHLFVTDDDQKEVFEIVAGSDGRFGTGDDTVSSFDTRGHGCTDPEGIDYDPVTRSLWIAAGEQSDICRVRAGADNRFGTSDDTWSQFDVSVFGALDPEGMAYDPVRDTVVIVDDSSETMYEFDKNGSLLNTISTASAGMEAAAGLAIAPRSNDPSRRSYYVVARGQDNDSHPNENDGKMYELAATLPPLGDTNQPPVVNAGADAAVTLPAAVSLDATVSDDGRPTPPGAVTTRWTELSGPGDVTFGSAGAVDTTASFSAAGTYVLRLTADDGAATTADEVTIVVRAEGSPDAVAVPVRMGSDDAEQSAAGNVSLSSSDLELTTEGTTVQTVGMRFTGVPVPAGATVTNAYVQFSADEVSNGAASITVRAESAVSPGTYTSAAGNITSRAVTSQSVSWTPAAWNTVGERGPAQRTPNFASVVQAVVARPAWVSGNAVALQFTGTGRRTADSFEGGAALAPVLHVEYSTGGGGTPTNEAPVVSAGADAAVTMPGSASLNGSVSDDGLPEPPGTVTTVWSRVSGPGAVTFGNAAAVDTTAVFSAAGTYVLRLAASDGALSAADEVTVTVQAAAGGGGEVRTFETRVTSGTDDVEESVSSGSVGLGSNDLELTSDGNTQQTVGTRFTGVQVPAGATVTNAWVQFRVDEVSGGPASISVRAESADNAPTYTATAGNVTARAVTTASVAWTPPDWSTAAVAGPGQRTPNLASVVQTVVNRPGWAAGNALALQFSGTGQRIAEAFEGGATFSPLLHIEYSTGAGGTPANQAPVVSAGGDVTVTLPASANVDGTVSDDGLPVPPGAVSTVWSRVSGPGAVTFGNAAAVDTTASFAAAGTYVLRLTASDGAMSAADEVTVVVSPAGPAPNQAPVVSAGADVTVTLPVSANLDGTVSDDGLPVPPGAVSTVWSRVSGPGAVTFGNAAAVDTTASFAAEGTYVLRLTASDGAMSAADEVTVTAQPAAGGGEVQTLQAPVRAGTDDAEERFNGDVLLTSYDLDVTADGSRSMSAVGLRFTDLGIPRGAVVTDAYVQFFADEAGSGAADLTVRAQAADSAPTFASTVGNLTARTTTSASVGWAPPAWAAGEAGAAQRTSNLAPVLQEVVQRPGWAAGNALVLLVTGTGDRTAQSFEHANDPVLHVEYTTGG